MQHISLAKIAHNLIRERLQAGGIAIDATVGNGYDTAFLVEQISPSGRVYGFDIQQAAIDSTRARVEACCGIGRDSSILTLVQASHVQMAEKIPEQDHGRIDAIMFNLGYLPGNDKSIITQTQSTLAALTVASRLLSGNGILTILAYPGHPGGDQESVEVKNRCEQLDKEQFKIRVFHSKEDKASAPRLYVVDKAGQGEPFVR
ncbi:MAG: class I SAM-dependent methyltransferase [Methylococcales bacterium]|nr:class I SAM-dependent methyltransferase [Methylococcales bacterium]